MVELITPTGSKITGIPASFARIAAFSIAIILLKLKVPKFKTRASALLVISSTSSGSSAITGEAPAARAMSAQLSAVT